MNSGFLPRAFQAFSLADELPGRVRSGLGLGLSIARSLVLLHDGVIEAGSEGTGKGSSFTVTLPAAAGSGEAAETGSFFDSSSLEGVLVLLVQDDEDALRAARSALEAAGAKVIATPSSTEAVEIFEKVGPGLVVSDLTLPGMNGVQLIVRLRDLEKERGSSRCRAIALTAAATPRDREAALEAGFDEYLAKPAGPEHLVTAARDVLDT